MPHDTPHEVYDLKLFSELTVRNYTYLIVRFYTTNTCSACKKLAPIYEELSEKHTTPSWLMFAQVDVDDKPEIAKWCGVDATHHHTSPPFLVFWNGKVLKDGVGEVLKSVSDETKELERVVAKVVEASNKAKKDWDERGRYSVGVVRSNHVNT
jgi:thioredoxin 1